MTRIQNIVSMMAICAAVALPLLAAEKLNAKIGLWETTATVNMGGMAMPALPPDVLAAMPPAQRAQIEQMMKPQMTPRTTTDKSCVTEKDLQEGAFGQQSQEDMKCTFTVVSSTSKHQETNFQCTSPAGPAAGKLVVDVIDATHVKGTMQMKAQQISIESKFDSKWLGADCGTTK
ncbi:MAG: DUF3617 domain-containing protein [Pseudomonadota bacterium]